MLLMRSWLQTIIISLCALTTVEVRLEIPSAYKNVNFYEVLGVREAATEDEIKRSYRKMAVLYHPDKHSDKDEEEQKKMEEEFKKVLYAKELLLDDMLRREYDAMRMSWADMKREGKFGNMPTMPRQKTDKPTEPTTIPPWANGPRINPCESRPCAPHGRCEPIIWGIFNKEFVYKGFKCDCYEGYKGATCSEECDYPAFGKNCANKCKNCHKKYCHHIEGCKKCFMGFTNDEVGKFGYRTRFPECTGLDCNNGRNPCKNLGACTHLATRCKCREQYTGVLCETFIEPDFSERFLRCNKGTQWKDCKNDGVCVIPKNSRGSAESKCICKGVFHGDLCKERCASGTPGICMNGDCGVHDKTKQMRCDCWDGYEGNTCDKKCSRGKYGAQCRSSCSNHCKKEPCIHITGFCPGGKCKDGWFGVRCSAEKSRYKEKMTMWLRLAFHNEGVGPNIDSPPEKFDQDSQESKQLITDFMTWMDEALSTQKRLINMRDIKITIGTSGITINQEEERKRRQAEVAPSIGIQCMIEMPVAHVNASAERKQIRKQMKAQAHLFESQGLSIKKGSIRLSKPRLTTFEDDDPSKNNGSQRPQISQVQAGITAVLALAMLITIVSGVVYRQRRRKTLQTNGRSRPIQMLKKHLSDRKNYPHWTKA